ncbi:Eco57I restriction-modification methylase domain-containing protein [Treponema sp.]|uniref:Eco57I restriction-modification methylase domain-containing protein n=1 Tax=Treponema sp. TaxID=166 RepID=UPI002A83D359|nr:N-6 DNA methylase [Treponema sp.]MDY4132514.1 N-6 DNA methylase [Treponema sp.]
MFQKKIVEKYLSKLDKELLEQKYDLFCSIFKNEKKIENIRHSKEEQYQEGFIRDLFVSVLGYTIKPEENYNILTELKNEVANKSNSKKSDGAICEENDENKIRAVIELKGTDTTDLDKVAFQAFSYKNFHNECNYVIVSNFERLRIYVETQIEFEEFNLFTLNFERFCILYLLLELNQLKADIPLKLKHETLSEEKQITDNFYADYSTFKRLLFEDLCENNLQSEECHADSENRHAELVSASGDDGKINKLLLFKKTQKLLDRILFILFCEDRNLLPPNSIAGIISDYQKLKEMGYGQPLYNVFKTYFDRIDKGYKNESDSSKNVFAYNGGLFKTDEVLDNIKVGDHVLYIHSKRLADYDFESQISVDILGRIFENSLTEIEEVQKEIEAEKSGEKVEINNIGKRKKDGVFYTPEYITKYIVENTIGKLCEQQRAKLNISDEEVAKAQTKKQKDTLNAALHEYQKWLFSLKIMDPACGSGAFLTAALTQLKAEHRRVFDFLHAINNDSMMFEEYSDNSILENNLYGVDINEESVEITKLSLWLHTAQKDRKLTTLNGKIKCGNSLIDDSTIAGEKAFNWEKEFPEVFAKGGFDVVIGNPPYVNMVNILNENERKFYQEHYKTVKNKSDLYSIFTEKAHLLLKKNGLFGFIFSNSWMGTDSFTAFREFLAKDVTVTGLTELPEKVFKDATVKTCICFYTNNKPTENNVINIDKCENARFSSKGFVLPYKQILENDKYNFSFEKTIVLNKIKTIPLKDIVSFSLGIKTSDDKRFIFNEKKDDDCYLFLRGRNIQRWGKPTNNEYLWYRPDLITQKPGGRPRVFENFTVDKKIVIQDMAVQINATLDKEKFLCNDKVNIIYAIKNKYSMEYILVLLNSKLINKWFKKLYSSGLEIKINQLETIPIPEIPLEAQQPFIALADKMLSLNETLQKKSTNFLKVVKQTFALEKISTKLETFYNLDFDGFMKELKQKVTPKTKLEWLEVFEETKKSLQEIQSQISATDKEINTQVYKLYDLTEEEIKTVEGR